MFDLAQGETKALPDFSGNTVGCLRCACANITARRKARKEGGGAKANDRPLPETPGGPLRRGQAYRSDGQHGELSGAVFQFANRLSLRTRIVQARI